VFQALADLVLLVHFGVVLFVIGGLGAIVTGGLRRWSWSASPLFRFSHLGAVGFVIVQAWLGQTCPLTSLESWLRVRAGGQAYGHSFIEHWVGSLLFYSAPTWVFTALYSAFGLAVLLCWWLFPMRRAPGATR
jgi:Protein of Unknown function (DUF2784)